MSNTFKIVARYQYSSEAIIAKGLLESEGILVFMSDNFTIDTDPLISNAIGGVKLKVPANQEHKALTILSSIKPYAINNEGEALICSNCKGNHVRLYSTITNLKSFFAFVIGFLFGTLPFSARYVYKCDDCKTEFNIK